MKSGMWIDETICAQVDHPAGQLFLVHCEHVGYWHVVWSVGTDDEPGAVNHAFSSGPFDTLADVRTAVLGLVDGWMATVGASHEQRHQDQNDNSPG